VLNSDEKSGPGQKGWVDQAAPVLGELPIRDTTPSDSRFLLERGQRNIKDLDGTKMSLRKGLKIVVKNTDVDII
jgi:hypothetical protein